jgi:hypothetical protein
MWSFAPRGIFRASLLKKYPAVGSFAPVLLKKYPAVADISSKTKELRSKKKGLFFVQTFVQLIVAKAPRYLLIVSSLI